MARKTYTRFFLVAVGMVLAASLHAETMLTVRGEMLNGPLTGGDGSWKIGTKDVNYADALVIRFSSDAPLPPPAGVFLRGGSLLTGTLQSIIGAQADVLSNLFGPLKLSRDDIAGAFVPPPAGQMESITALTHYCDLLAGSLGAYDALLAPGQRCRVVFAGLDELNADHLMRLGTEQILFSGKNKGVETVSRQFARVIELAVPPADNAANATRLQDPRLVAEVFVTLKSGDLLRGRIVRLNDQGLTLKTTYAGERTLPRSALAALFLASGPASGVTWLSTEKPAKSVHVPLFDSAFPAKMDTSVDGNDLRVGGQPLERGLGVHSKSELVYDLTGGPKRFISVCGIDAESNGRGQVTARVLADGREVWKSGAVTGKDEAKVVAADLGPARTLTLQVDYGPDGDDSGDHFDWGWAALVGK